MAALSDTAEEAPPPPPLSHFIVRYFQPFCLSALPFRLSVSVSLTHANALPPRLARKVTVDVDSEYTGAVIDRLTGSRRGVMMEMKDAHEGKVRTPGCLFCLIRLSVCLSVCLSLG